jgi:transcriptional regulator with XRE-family HTH domain
MRINGAVLVRLRYGKGLRQSEVADATGIKQTVLSRLETGKRHGTPAQIMALADFFDVSIDDLCAEQSVA